MFEPLNLRGRLRAGLWGSQVGGGEGEWEHRAAETVGDATIVEILSATL
jgi:hypothetical protein